MTKVKSGKNHPIKVAVTQTIHAPAEEIFPLACPVMEYKWIPNWKCELIHCPNGHVELGCVFNEIFSAPLLTKSVAQKTTWTAVLYEPDQHRVHYRLDNELSSSLYKIEFEVDAPGKTKARIEITHRPLNEKGVNIANNGGEGRLRLMTTALMLMLKYYCEQGTMIPLTEVIKTVLRSQDIAFSDRVRIALNDLAMRFMRDDDKKRFQKGIPIRRVKSA